MLHHQKHEMEQKQGLSECCCNTENYIVPVTADGMGIRVSTSWCCCLVPEVPPRLTQRIAGPEK